LLIELEFELKKIDKNSIKTVFIGGGTPSVLGFEYYKQIFDKLKGYLAYTKEITIEANPNSATKQWLEDIYSLGVNRVSFGVQSFDDEKLKFLGRNHTSNMAISAIQNASEIGFKHINCDIIYDTKLDNKKLLKQDLNIIKNLPIDHISAYSLTIEKQTDFYGKKNIKVQNLSLTKYLFKRLKKLGFIQYEISNFAKNKNARSKHNIGYWKLNHYIGIGCGAVGYINNKRLYNNKDIKLYNNNPTIFDNEEILTTYDNKVEKVLLGLRCKIGFDKKLLSHKELLRANILLKEKKIKLKINGKFYNKNFLLADEITLFILE
jgi:oxygen-independent coproporphyrinogen-3 oxidase